MMVSLYQQTTKVWVVLAVLWGCSISMAQPPTVRFDLRTATRLSYMFFITELRTELFRYGNTNGEIALLPDRSSRDMGETSPRRYVLVELLDGDQSVTIALDVTSVYVLGYRPGTGTRSHFFPSVSEAVRNVVFPNTQGQRIPFTENYGSLEQNAGRRSEVPLGIDELRTHVQNMNNLEPTGPNAGPLARALLVCIQMISEAARFRFIEQEIAAVAQPREGGYYEMLYPDGLMIEFENSWRPLSRNVQSAIHGVFPVDVPIVFDPQEEPLIFDTVASVRFIVALMPVICLNRRANRQVFEMPPSLSSSALPGLHVEDETFETMFGFAFSFPEGSTGLQENNETCDVVLAPRSYIIGQNGLCVDVFQGSYHDGNKIILWKCGQSQANQLWTLRSEDNTIRSDGKCLTTYGYSSGSYVMIYDCDKAVPDATKWEIRSDGAIRNPKSGLVLTGSKDSSGMINLVVDFNTNASKQAFYASNLATSPMTTIVSYQGLCLVASGSQVRLENCAGKDAEQQWAVSPDGTISPRVNRNECLKYANAGGAATVNLATCDGWIGERWRLQNDGTILHVGTRKVLDVEDTTITVNAYNKQRLSQIWFQGKP
ncbi:hypothetical protein V6N13_115834 [Hibiscus sabdariffa]|uniref:Ribosome-inactivating protein n=1 Tax=Hibiscus sabdariffa TaxID=183260 RepID=A0ABR2CUP0_9ROSI